MKITDSTPLKDNYRMPGEFEQHQGCLMVWPIRPGSWIYGGTAAKKAFTNVATAISTSEKVYMLSDQEHMEEARQSLPSQVEVIEMATNDSWARDIGPTFVVDERCNVRGVNWQFNAWGGEFDGLYSHWELDDKVASAFCNLKGYDYYDASHFVLEGGSIHSDGEGTVLVTEACLLSKGRNPELSKEQIEDKLREYLGAEKIVWLPRGIYNDETNEHVDNVCCFARPGVVVLAWTDDESDPQYAMSKSCLDVLAREKDARGRSFEVIKLPVPASHVCITEEELAGFEFEEGEDEREPGERLAASYVNFYIANNSVIVPQFNDINDTKALKILAQVFTEREIVPIYARDIIVGGGNIHCITQQIPAGRRTL